MTVHYPPNEAYYTLDLPAWLALNAPDPDLDVIYEHVKRLTGETRKVISADLSNPRGIGSGSYGYNVNVHGDDFYTGRTARFVVVQGKRITVRAWDYDGPEYEYGWEIHSPIVKADGSRYRSGTKQDDGSIEWQRLD